MTKVLVLYYSSYGHIEKMAYAVAEGAREAGATVDVKRVAGKCPRGDGEGFLFQARSTRADRDAGRTGEL